MNPAIFPKASGQAADPEALALRIQSLQLRQAFDRHRSSALWTLAAIALFVAPLMSLWPFPRTWAWLACLLIVLVARVLVGLAFRRTEDRLQDVQRWRRFFVLGAAAAGLSWAVGPVLLVPVVPSPQTLLLALITVSVSAIAVSQMSALFPASVAFVLAALLPTVAVLLVPADPTHLVAALMVACASGMLVLTGRSSARAHASRLRAEFRLGDALEEARLRASQETAAAAEREVEVRRLSTIVAGTGAGVAELDLSTGQVRVNERFASMIGRHVDELEAMDPATFGSLFSEQDLKAFGVEYQALLQSQRSEVDFEVRLRHAEGRWIWCQLRVRVLSRASSGEPLLVSGTYVDVTDRREAEQRWRARAELSADWFWETDPQFRVTLLSDGVRHGLPIPHSHLIGHTLADVRDLHPVDAGWSALLASLSAHRPFSDFALAIDPEEGERRVVELDGRPRFGDHGEFLGYEGVGRDVTERRRATESMKESLLLVDSLFEAMPIPVVMKDAQGRYVRANKAYRDMMAFPTGTVQHVSEITDQAASALHRSMDDELLRHPGVRRYEVRQTMDSGRFIHGLVHKASLVNAQGRIFGLVATLIDITDERAAATALQAARDAAEQANRAKSAFLATMSHELRTPLNAVIGAAQLLRNSNAGTDERDALLAAIENSGLSLLGLIESVMDLSRIEAAELKLTHEPFDLIDCVDRAVATVCIAARDRGLRVAAVVAPGVPGRRIGDAARLRQVLLNLLGNAVKFTPAGEVVLELDDAGEVAPGCRWLRITVQDTGVGIDEQALEAIFEPFKQEESGPSRRFSGSGLGLAIVRELVQAMGGQVAVRSEKGRGSCFEVQIPLPVDGVGAAPEALRDPPPRKGRVAVHEPHAASSRALQAALVRQGFEPQEWTGPRDLAGLTLDAAPEWLLLADDSECAEAVWKCLQPWVPDTRVIRLVEASRRLHGVAEGAASNAQARLMRPVSQTALAALLSRPANDARRSDGGGPVPVAPVDGAGVALRVLLVEDDPTNQVITAGMLSHRGYEVVTAEDGYAALDLLARERFHLVLMDWQMPGMDGLEVTRRIRAGAAGPQAAALPIVAVTANAFLEDRQACLAAGMNDFVSKPLRLDGLLDTVARWIRAETS